MPGSERVRVEWRNLRTSRLGRILQRLRAAIRRVPARDLAERLGIASSEADLLNRVLAILMVQWVAASATRSERVNPMVDLTLSEATSCAEAARRLEHAVTDEARMKEVGTPAIARTDAAVLHEFVDTLASACEKTVR